jgi:hypothetical protein
MSTNHINDLKLLQTILNEKIEAFATLHNTTTKELYNYRGLCFKRIDEDQMLHFDSLRRLQIDNNQNLKELEFLNTPELAESRSHDSVFRHESYGQVRVTRTSGGSGNLYGCSVQHQQQLCITISRSEWCRGLNHDRYHTAQPLIEFHMSYDQWGQFLSGVGTEGTPCTISRIGLRAVEQPEFVNRTTLLHKEFKQQMESITRKLSTLTKQTNEKLLAKGTITASERQEIAGNLNSIIQDISSNLPYAVNCYNETTAGMLTEAKIELDAMILQHNLTSHISTDKLINVLEKPVIDV